MCFLSAFHAHCSFLNHDRRVAHVKVKVKVKVPMFFRAIRLVGE
jgi:hypothetical protein